MHFVARLVADSMNYKMQADKSEVWFDALEGETSFPASPLEASLSPVRSPSGVACASPTRENDDQSHQQPWFQGQNLLLLLVHLVVCQAILLFISNIWHHPAAFVASIALMWLAKAEPQQRAKMSAAAHRLARHAQHHAVQAWRAVSRSWCCCWSAAAALATLMWRLNAQCWLYVRSSAAARFAAVRAIRVSAWTSTAALWAAICHSSGRSWSYVQSRAASMCTLSGCISHAIQISSWQVAAFTAAAVQILCCTAWSILCHLLVITGAAVLTTGVIVLSTLLAAGFVATSIMSAAAAMCKLWFAAAAYRVTGTARAAVPVVKTTVASCLSACLSIWRHIGAAVQILCYTAWSILCHLLVITGAAVLTTGVIVLSTLLAAGFVAASMVSVAAATCKLCYAAAAYRVTGSATAALQSTAASFLSTCLSILTQRPWVTARAATQGSIAVAAATVHGVHALCLKASQHIPSAVEAMWAACAKLQRPQPGLSMVAVMAPLLSSYAVYYAGSFENLLSSLVLCQLYSEGLQGHSKGLMLITGLHLCQHSLPDGYALAQLLLIKGPAMLGVVVSAICVVLCVGYYLSLPPEESAASCNCLVRSLASACDWALTGLCKVHVFLS